MLSFLFSFLIFIFTYNCKFKDFFKNEWGGKGSGHARRVGTRAQLKRRRRRRRTGKKMSWFFSKGAEFFIFSSTPKHLILFRSLLLLLPSSLEPIMVRAVFSFLLCFLVAAAQAKGN